MPLISRLDKLVKERMPAGTTLADAAGLRQMPLAITCVHWHEPQAQAVIYTLVNLALRTFKGPIYLVGLAGEPAVMTWGVTAAGTFHSVLTRLAADIDDAARLLMMPAPPDVPLVAVGEPATAIEPPAITICAEGWGVALNTPLPEEFRGLNPVSAVLGACFVVAKLLAKALGDDVLGEQLVLSSFDYSRGRPKAILPSWPANGILPPISLLGGGAIGNGFIYTALLAPNRGTALNVIDGDWYQRENLETSLAVTKGMVEREAMKAEAMAELARLRFTTPWAVDRRIQEGDPLLQTNLGLVVLGPDNVEARLLFENANTLGLLNGGIGGDVPGSEGVTMISCHGLGRRTLEYLYRFTPRSGPSAKAGTSADEVLASTDASGVNRDRLAEFAGDPCSMLSYMGASIGASFLGGAVGAMLYGEVIKTALIPGYHSPSYASFDLFGLLARPRIR